MKYYLGDFVPEPIEIDDGNSIVSNEIDETKPGENTRILTGIPMLEDEKFARIFREESNKNQFRSEVVDILEEYLFPRSTEENSTITKITQKISDLAAIAKQDTFTHDVIVVSHKFTRQHPINGVKWLHEEMQKTLEDASDIPLIFIFRQMNLYMEVARSVSLEARCGHRNCTNKPNWRLSNKLAWLMVDFLAELIVKEHYHTTFKDHEWDDILTNDDLLYMPPSAFLSVPDGPPNSPVSQLPVSDHEIYV